MADYKINEVCQCKYPNAQFASTGTGIPISSTVLFWIPLPEIFHLVRYPNAQFASTGTGRDSCRPISGIGLCQLRYGHSIGPVPELDSIRAVPFPVRGSASSGTVIFRVPYQN